MELMSCIYIFIGIGIAICLYKYVKISINVVVVKQQEPSENLNELLDKKVDKPQKIKLSPKDFSVLFPTEEENNKKKVMCIPYAIKDEDGKFVNKTYLYYPNEEDPEKES